MIGLAAALSAAEPEPARISRDISAKIREGLPTYQPPAAPAEGGSAGTEGSQTSDPNVLILPKLTVKEKRLPPDAADQLMSRDDFKRKMENLYLDEIAKDGPLNYLLNKFTIPILSPSKAERGKAIYQRRELDRLRHVSDAARSLDPNATKKLERDLDNSHTTRPAGGLPKK
ncbi:hypothetical protein ESB00_13795 [Oleiharenicola lentus]|uniref:Uncharacterized protein n=1 Tax=Oleiharenicola lentus TaxID=2508720 RepID=A0A4Q1C3H6_9BACT|nr:hypothetical protein ESB00_13795 [Oleiharenicola lentus]